MEGSKLAGRKMALSSYYTSRKDDLGIVEDDQLVVTHLTRHWSTAPEPQGCLSIDRAAELEL